MNPYLIKKNLSRSIVAFLVIATTFALPGCSNSEEETKTNKPTPTINKTSLSIPEQPRAPPPPPAPEPQSVTVKKGDTLTHIFRRVGLGPRQVHQVSQLNSTTKILARLTPGQIFDFIIDDDGQLQQVTYHVDKINKLIIRANNGKLETFREKREYDKSIAHTSSIINTSLFGAANKAGLSDKLTMELAHIFGWDIDFALDIRKGDRFTLIYEKLSLDGEHIRDGHILAAEFVNQNKVFKAIRYSNENLEGNFYSETGSSMRKAFLRSPVDFTRISSRFGKRHHPIHKKWKSHKGVDYAAPRGTPIKAAGAGKVIWRSRKGGYGKTVIIKHANRYSTLYAHMNNYNRKAKLGARVTQGQVIGYVGSTGSATGPHLHYEFRVNDVHRNPLTVKLPNAAALPKQYRADFKSKSRPLIARLDAIRDAINTGE